MNKVTFSKEKIAQSMKVSAEYIESAALKIGVTQEDFMFDELSVVLEAFVVSRLIEERELVYYCPRPTFFDWLFRRQNKLIFKTTVKEFLRNPHPMKTARIVEIDLDQVEPV